MSGESDNGGTIVSSPSEQFDVDAYVDATDRLERAMDTQVQILEGIDNKAEHITRLIALLIGIIFSVISFVTQLSRTPISPPPSTILAAFGIGVGSLLISMGTAIITYLSSQYKIGLHGDVGEVLSDESFAIEMPEHIRNVLGTYSFVIDQNRKVIETNVSWFRFTLFFLLIGVLFVSLAGFLYLADFGWPSSLLAVLCGLVLTLAIGWYILTGRFLPLQDVGSDNE